MKRYRPRLIYKNQLSISKHQLSNHINIIKTFFAFAAQTKLPYEERKISHILHKSK